MSEECAGLSTAWSCIKELVGMTCRLVQASEWKDELRDLVVDAFELNKDATSHPMPPRTDVEVIVFP